MHPMTQQIDQGRFIGEGLFRVVADAAQDAVQRIWLIGIDEQTQDERLNRPHALLIAERTDARLTEEKPDE